MFKEKTKAVGRFIAVGTAGLGYQLANAAGSSLPAGVDTGISGAQASGLEVVGLLAAAGAAVWLISKVLKKFGLMM